MESGERKTASSPEWWAASKDRGKSETGPSDSLATGSVFFAELLIQAALLSKPPRQSIAHRPEQKAPHYVG
jgi:hypothetical protein